MQDLRLFVKHAANAVAAKLAHYREAGFLERSNRLIGEHEVHEQLRRGRVRRFRVHQRELILIGRLAIHDLELELAQKTKDIRDADLKETEEAEKKKADIRMQTIQGVMQVATDVTNAIGALQEMQMAKELKGAGDNLAKQEEIKKKYFEKNKKLQIANAIIGAIQGAVQAFTSLASIPVVGPALGAVAAAAETGWTEGINGRHGALG